MEKKTLSQRLSEALDARSHAMKEQRLAHIRSLNSELSALLGDGHPMDTRS